MSKAHLRKLVSISSATLKNLRRSQEDVLSVLMKIAAVLDCDALDMISFILDTSFLTIKE